MVYQMTSKERNFMSSKEKQKYDIISFNIPDEIFISVYPKEVKK